MVNVKKPHILGIEILKKNGINVDKLIKELVINASVEFTAYYYLHYYEQIVPASKVKE